MDPPYSDSDIYSTKAVTWVIRSNSTWHCNSPAFELNNEECSLKINIVDSGYSNQFNIGGVTLNFTKCYPDCYHQKFIVVLRFANIVAEYIFHLLSTDVNSKKSFSDTRTVSVSRNNHSSITAVIFHQKLKESLNSSFINNMKYMMKSEIYSDFKIKAGDNIFKVHKAIIAVRSEVLKRMVENNMKEKNIGQLELQADPTVVQVLLDYLYTNKCKVSLVPIELFKLAHFLHLDELQMDCKDYLLKNINFKNIITILELTSFTDFGLADLHDAAMQFVNENEDSLITDLEFQEYLCKNIKLETITYILRLSYKHNLDNCLNKAMEFVKTHYDKVLILTEIENYLKSQPTLCLNILRYCLDYDNVNSDKKE